MMKVYVVTSGAYSDYSIDRVFTDEKLANQYVDERKSSSIYNDEFRVEEYEVTTSLPKPRIVLNLSCAVRGTGDIVLVREWSFTDWDGQYKPVQVVRMDPPALAKEVTGLIPARQLHVRGYDHDRVRKSYQDRIAQMRAENLGLA